MPARDSSSRATARLPSATVTTAAPVRQMQHGPATDHVAGPKGKAGVDQHRDSVTASCASCKHQDVGVSKTQKHVSGRSSLLRQARAVLLKDMALARRSWIGAIGILCLPILLLGLLLVVQHLVDQELSGPDYRCGCQCLACCDWVPTGTTYGSNATKAPQSSAAAAASEAGYEWRCYNASPSSPCTSESSCQQYNESNCGPQFSSYKQIAFCALPDPPTWPPLIQVPLDQYRPPSPHQASGDLQNLAPANVFSNQGGPVVLPYTGNDPALSAMLMSLLLPNDTGIGTRLIQAALASPALRTAALGQGLNSQVDLCQLAAQKAAAAGPAGLNTGSLPGLPPPPQSGGNASGAATAPPMGISLGTLAQLMNGSSSTSAAGTTAGSSSSSGSGSSQGAGSGGGMDADTLASLTALMTQVFSNFSFVLGTPVDTSPSLLLEPAFLAGSPVLGSSAQSSSSSGMSSASGGLGPPGGIAGDFSVSRTQVLPLYFLSDNCTAIATRPGADLTALRQVSCGLQYALGVPLVCATVAPQWQPSKEAVDSELFCGWQGSRCDPTSTAVQAIHPTPAIQAVPSPAMQPPGVHGTASPAAVQQSATGGSTAPTGSSSVVPASSTSPNSSSAGSSQPLRKLMRVERVDSQSDFRMLQQQSVKSDQMQSELRELQQPGEGGVMLGRTTVSSQQYLTDIQQSQQHYAVVVGNHQRMLQQSQPQAQVSQGQLNQSQGIIQYPSAVYDWGNTNLGRARSAQQQQKAGLDVALWLNNTNLQGSVAPNVQRWPGPINLMSSAFLAAAWGSAGGTATGGNASTRQPLASASPALRLEGVRGFPNAGGPLVIDLASLLGPLFIMFVMQLPLPVIVHALGSERAGGQLGLMRRQGLSAGAHALATYAWCLMQYVAFMVVFVAFGIGTGQHIFTSTSAGVQILLYLAWFHAMFGMAAWMAVAYESVLAAVLGAIALLIFSGLVANLVVVQFVTAGPEWVAVLLEAVAPPFALFRALWEAAQYAFLAGSVGSNTGLTLPLTKEPGNGYWLALGLMVAQCAVLLCGAMYWDQVFGSGELVGPRQHPYFWLGFKLGPDDPRGWAWFAAQGQALRWKYKKHKAEQAIPGHTSGHITSAGHTSGGTGHTSGPGHTPVTPPLSSSARLAQMPGQVVSRIRGMVLGCVTYDPFSRYRNAAGSTSEENDSGSVVTGGTGTPNSSSMPDSPSHPDRLNSNLATSPTPQAPGACSENTEEITGSHTSPPAPHTSVTTFTPQSPGRQEKAVQKGHGRSTLPPDVAAEAERVDALWEALMLGAGVPQEAQAAESFRDHIETELHNHFHHQQQQQQQRVLISFSRSEQGLRPEQVPAVLMRGVRKVFRSAHGSSSTSTAKESVTGGTGHTTGSTGHSNGNVHSSTTHTEALVVGPSSQSGSTLSQPNTNGPAQGVDQVVTQASGDNHLPSSLTDGQTGQAGRDGQTSSHMNGGGAPAAGSVTAAGTTVTSAGLNDRYPAISSSKGSSTSGVREKVAVDCLHLAISQRECFGLLGPNGAGKTTTLRLLQGLLEPSAGSIHVCGIDVTTRPGEAARLIGICPQHDALWGSLSPSEHLHLYGRLRGLSGPVLAAAVTSSLSELGLAPAATSTTSSTACATSRNRAPGHGTNPSKFLSHDTSKPGAHAGHVRPRSTAALPTGTQEGRGAVQREQGGTAARPQQPSMVPPQVPRMPPQVARIFSPLSNNVSKDWREARGEGADEFENTLQPAAPQVQSDSTTATAASGSLAIGIADDSIPTELGQAGTWPQQGMVAHEEQRVDAEEFLEVDNEQAEDVQGHEPEKASKFREEDLAESVPAAALVSRTLLLKRGASAAHQPSSQLSGGMRRRLSVACALVGAPPVACLDEPSAGLDPASRAALWQAVRSARRAGTAIILTTHSMGEAESLCDRLGVFVNGRLQCIGSAAELTARYASSLLLALTVSPGQEAAAQAAVLSHVSPTARLVSSAGGALNFELPRTGAGSVGRVYAAVAGRLAAPAGPLELTDWAVSTATLDHVFSAILAAANNTNAEPDGVDQDGAGQDEELALGQQQSGPGTGSVPSELEQVQVAPVMTGHSSGQQQTGGG